MSYIGNTSTTQAFTPAVDYFSGNGSTVAFTLSRPVASVAQIQVNVNNVQQNPGSAYTVSGNTITFTGAPSSGTNNIYVYYTSPITQVISPGQNTVYPSSLSYTNALYWDTSGNVGIGTSSPNSKLQVKGPINVERTNTTDYSIIDNEGNFNLKAATGGVGGSFNMTFTTAGSERARIDSSGNLLVGTTSGIAYATRLTLSTDSGTNKWAVGPYATSSAFIIAANTSFGVYLPTTSATSWSNASDERLKENLVEITNAVSKVASLRAVTGNYISDETKSVKPFLIAQDVQTVLPEAVTTMPDGEHLGIAYTEVIPLLVAAIKEQQALITQLQADVAALKGQA